MKKYVNEYQIYEADAKIEQVREIIENNTELYYQEMKGEGADDAAIYEVAKERAFEEAKDTLEMLEMDKEEITEQLVNIYKNKAALVDGIGKNIDTLKSRAEHEKYVMTRLEELIALSTNGKGAKTAEYEVKYTKSAAVEVKDLELIPSKYKRAVFAKVDADKVPEGLTKYVKEYEPQKTLIKKDIKAGVEVPGAEIEEKVNIKIK